jgi:hypothetical protein
MSASQLFARVNANGSVAARSAPPVRPDVKPLTNETAP